MLPKLLAILLFPTFCLGATSYNASSPTFSYEGRWDTTSSATSYRSDWPCARVTFGVEGEGEIKVHWKGLRVRLNATVWDEDGAIVGSSLVRGERFGRALKEEVTVVNIPAGGKTVTIRRLTEGANFGAGIGMKLLTSSMWEFQRIESENVVLSLASPRKYSIEYIGASDTAGYCVDGTPEITGAALYLNGWEYDNCDAATPALLGYRFNTNVHVAAEGGLGLTQNAPGEGRTTMREYWNGQTLLTEKMPKWEGPREGEVPDLVVVSLGGNDYNHHRGHVPSDEEFEKAYGDFLMEIFTSYESIGGEDVKILNVCGQGSPAEAEYDPDNNRCSPCPRVEAAVEKFKDDNMDVYGDRTEYLFIPCDGSVVNDDNDIGCGGHKNRVGQGKVAEFVMPVVEGMLVGS